MPFPDHVYGVVLAGGSGTRFWPRSTQRSPKQLAKIANPHEAMIETTLKRLDGWIPAERRLIVTHQLQLAMTKQVVGPLCLGYIAEPEARNTAAALALAALQIRKRHSGEAPAVMVSLHADHVIKNHSAFLRTLEAAIEVADRGMLTLIGIIPDSPETGYGYIEKGEALGSGIKGFRVSNFKEKPSKDLAETYIATGRYLWNSGMFVWQVDTLLEELQAYLPDTYKILSDALELLPDGFPEAPTEQLAASYAQLPKIAIDDGILEKSSKVAVVEGDMGWKDIGSWDALSGCLEEDARGNVSAGESLLIDCDGCVLHADDDHIIAALGLKDIVAVVCDNRVLVTHKDRAQDVKKIVEALKADGRSAFT